MCRPQETTNISRKQATFAPQGIKGKKIEPKVSRRKEGTKIKADVNKTKTEEIGGKKSMKPRTETEKTLKRVWNHERPSVVNVVLRENRGIRPPQFQLYYNALIIKRIWYWCKNQHTDQWNSRADQEINPSTGSINLGQKSQENTMRK